MKLNNVSYFISHCIRLYLYSKSQKQKVFYIIPSDKNFRDHNTFKFIMYKTNNIITSNILYIAKFTKWSISFNSTFPFICRQF